MAASTKLSPLKVWGSLNTTMIRHIGRIVASIVSFGFGWAKALMLPDMAGGAGDPPKLELRIKAGILFVAPFALGSSLGNKGHLFTQGGMTGHAEAPFLRAILVKVDDLAPGAWPHSHTVYALLPVPVLIWVAVSTRLGFKRSLRIRETGGR